MPFDVNWELVGPWAVALAALLTVLNQARWQRAQARYEATKADLADEDLRHKKEAAADRAAIRNYEWYDGTIASAIKMVEWLRVQLETERARGNALEKQLDEEREARRDAIAKVREAARREVHDERDARAADVAHIELRRLECEERIKELEAEIERMKLEARS